MELGRLATNPSKYDRVAGELDAHIAACMALPVDQGCREPDDLAAPRVAAEEHESLFRQVVVERGAVHVVVVRFVQAPHGAHGCPIQGPRGNRAYAQPAVPIHRSSLTACT